MSNERRPGGEKQPQHRSTEHAGGNKTGFKKPYRPQGGEHSRSGAAQGDGKAASGRRDAGRRPVPGAGRDQAHGRPAQHPYRGRPATRPPVKRQAPAPDGLAARRVALRVIRAVTEEGAYASLALDEQLTRSGLSPADRRLAARLAYDTLERLLYLDWALDQIEKWIKADG